MKAAVYRGKESVELTALPTPVAGDDDVVIQNLYASICGTDVAVYRHGPGAGHRITVGDEFGHEVISRVAQAGRNVKDFAVGDIVYPYPLLARGDASRAGTLGAFSEYILVPSPQLNRQLYLLNPRIPVRAGCLIEPFTVGCRAARRSGPRPGEKAVVFGAGTIGIAAAIALKHFGCGSVLVCDHSDFRLDKAKRLGFDVCNTARSDLAAEAMRLFGAAPSLSGPTADADVYIDAAGAPDVLPAWQRMGKIGSRMVVVAVSAGMKDVDVLHMTYAQQALIGSGGYMPEDVTTVMEIMAGGGWDVESIITHEFPWERLPEAIEQAGRVDEALNVIIRYE